MFDLSEVEVSASFKFYKCLVSEVEVSASFKFYKCLVSEVGCPPPILLIINAVQNLHFLVVGIVPIFHISLFPLKCAFFVQIEKTKAKHGHEYQHGQKTFHAHLPEVDGVGVKKHYLYVEQHKKDGREQVFHRNREAGVALGWDAALKVQVLGLAAALGAEQRHKANGQHDKTQRYKGLDANWQII